MMPVIVLVLIDFSVPVDEWSSPPSLPLLVVFGGATWHGRKRYLQNRHGTVEHTLETSHLPPVPHVLLIWNALFLNFAFRAILLGLEWEGDLEGILMHGMPVCASSLIKARHV